MSADVKKVDPKQVKRLKFAGTAYAVVLIVVLLGLYAFGFFNLGNKTHLFWSVVILAGAIWNFVVFNRMAANLTQRLQAEAQS